jgi:ADP-ribose pyrophosphatase
VTQQEPPQSPHEQSQLTETTISSELVYDGAIIHLYIDEVRLINGHHKRREVIRHNGAVAIVPIDAQGNVVLVRQFRYAAGRVLLEVPAGTLEPNEAPEVCAARELQEEAGYRPGKLERLGGIYAAPSYTTEFIHLYMATDLEASRLDVDDDEFLEVYPLPMDEVIRLIEAGDIRDGKTISGVLLARERLGKAGR